MVEKMKDFNRKLMTPAILAVSGAVSLLVIYLGDVWIDYAVTGEIPLRWYAFTKSQAVVVNNVLGLLFTGALGGIIFGGIGWLILRLGFKVTNRVIITIVLGIVGTLVLVFLFNLLLISSAGDHGPTAPGG